MSIERSLRDHVTLSKRIPLHYQKRYLANISNGSFNASHMTGIYKNKIKTLLKTNRVLALALQNDRAKKEELMEENKHNANIITFSRLKLASLSNNLKTVVSILDETLCLLEMHSSVSSSKFTPKNTLGRDEFKEQVMKVFMDPIPEEPASPQNIANKKNNEAAYSRHRHHFKKETTPEINVEKNHQTLEKPLNCGKNFRCNESKKKQSTEGINENYVNTLNHGAKRRNIAPTISVNSFEEKSPVKLVKNKMEKLRSRNKNLTLDACRKKESMNQAASKNVKSANKNVVGKNKKRVRSSNKNVNNQENNSPAKYKFYKSKLRNNIEVLNVEEPGNNTNEKKNTDVACMLKKSVSPIKLVRDSISDPYVISDCEKENGSSIKNQKKSAKKLKSFGEDELISAITTVTTTRRTYGHSSALKSLSSRINIENSKESCDKGKTSQLDDLITMKQKSAGLMSATKSPEIYDESKSYLQDLTWCQQQMVKNLAENTFLVTAEVHKNLSPLKADKSFKKTESFTKAECPPIEQPVILVRDCFESGKTLCKNISRQAGDELNRMPLELQLLEQCSSLKVIPEESENTSIEQTQHKSQETKVKNIELPLPIEIVKVKEEPIQEKRTFRKRPASINYKDPNLHVKLRR